MGMLLTYREGYWPEGQEPKPGKPSRKRRSRSTKPAEPVTPVVPVDPYADLTDDQVLEAYATNVPDGSAEDRDAMVAELQALDAEGNTPDE